VGSAAEPGADGEERRGGNAEERRGSMEVSNAAGSRESAGSEKSSGREDGLSL